MRLQKRQWNLTLKNLKKTVGLSITFLSLFVSPITATATNALLESTSKQPNIQNKIKANSQAQPEEFYLIIQSCRKAVIEKNNDASKPGTFKFTLYDVSPYATAFTQRPIRKVELISRT